MYRHLEGRVGKDVANHIVGYAAQDYSAQKRKFQNDLNKIIEEGSIPTRYPEYAPSHRQIEQARPSYSPYDHEKQRRHYDKIRVRNQQRAVRQASINGKYRQEYGPTGSGIIRQRRALCR